MEFRDSVQILGNKLAGTGLPGNEFSIPLVLSFSDIGYYVHQGTSVQLLRFVFSLCCVLELVLQSALSLLPPPPPKKRKYAVTVEVLGS